MNGFVRLLGFGLVLGFLVLPPPSALAAPVGVPPDPFNNLQFRSLGPAVAGGRVTTVVGIPGNPRVYYIGAAGGGVWKSVDGGYIWKPVFNSEATSSISDVVLDPSNPGIVWVATGETNPRNDVLDGAGLYRSTDAGNTWQLMGFKDAGGISKVVVDPHNSNIVWVSVLGDIWGPNAERGVFKTTDGGKTWKKVLFVNDHTGAIDLRMDGDNPQVLFAAMWQAQRKPWQLIGGGPGSGLWRSTDGGDTWTKLTDGIPESPLGRISVAPAPSNPERVYALIQSTAAAIPLFESNDMGEHWHQVTDNREVDGRGMYYTQLYVAPHDENKLYSMSLDVMESDDAGQTWREITHAPLDQGRPLQEFWAAETQATRAHGDQHALWVDPDDPDRMILGDDGGVYITLEGGRHWRFADTLPIEQIYSVAADGSQPYRLCIGLQDNNGWCGPSDPDDGFQFIGPTPWMQVVVGDGQYVVPAPSDPDIIYADSQSGNFIRYDLKTHTKTVNKPNQVRPSAKTGNRQYRFNWTAPIAVSPTDVNTVFLAANVVFKSTDGGAHWNVISPDLTRNDKSEELPVHRPAGFIGEWEHHDTLLSMSLAPTDPNVIWTGSDDGLIHVTRDGGQQWSNVTPPGAPHWGRVYQIGVSPFNPGTAYVGYDDHEMDDHKAYVYATDDYGKSWHSIANGLPQEPVLVVREDPNQRGFLVLGDMTGLWFSRDSGGHWQKFESGCPTAPVFDLEFVRHDLVVATHGRGLYVLHNLRPFEEMNAAVAEQTFHLFTPSAGTEYLAESGHRPQPVRIDYYLKAALAPTTAEKSRKQTPVQITVTDSAGRLVAKGYGPAMAGINEYDWMMRYPGATPIVSAHSTASAGLLGPQGLIVLPGTYQVSVEAAGTVQSATITVRADPNLNIPMQVQHANLNLALEARNNLSAFNEMVNRISGMQKTLEDFERAHGNAADQQAKFAGLLAQARSLDKKLTTLKDSVYRGPGNFSFSSGPLLDRDLLSIGSAGGFGGRSARVMPSPQILADAKAAWDELGSKLAEFNALLGSEVVNYNKAAFAAGAPTLMSGEPISVKPVQM